MGSWSSGVELVGFGADPDAVACVLRHRDGRAEQVRARYVVGCDGARSTVRRAAKIAFQGGAYPQTFALADLEVEPLDRDAAHAFLAEEGIVLFFPLGRPASWRMLAMHPSLQGRREPAQPSLEELQALADAMTDGSVRLRDPVWRTYFGLQHRHATRYRDGRLFLAGDAAHVHSPAGAQGMNTGIQDAWNLGWKLALVSRGIAEEALLDTYDAERRPVGASWSGSPTGPSRRRPRPTRCCACSAPRSSPGAAPGAEVRPGRGVRLPDRLPAQHRLPAQPGRPGRPPWLRRGPRAGDRLPDARVARDGQECWLGEALVGPGFHLLLCGPPGDWHPSQLTTLRHRYPDTLAVHHLTRAATPDALHDVGGQVFVRLGIDGTGQYLVRPDGHIGYRCGGDDLAGLQRYLARWLPTTTSRAV